MIRALAVVLPLGLTACGGAAPTADAGVIPAACLEAAPTDAGYPPGPYGTEIGDTIADFALEDCDGASVRLGDTLAAAKVVLITVGAGWCEPCIEEHEDLVATTFAPFCARGLRVLDIVFEDDNALPATRLFCRGWRDRFTLPFPVLVDPLFTMRAYFGGPASTQTPLNLLIDGDGVIRWRSTGVAPADLPAEIERLLP